MKTHTLKLTDDQLTVAIALMHAGAASLTGDLICLIKAMELLASVKDHEKRAEELQEILLSASRPAAWEQTMNWMAAKERRN